MSMRTWLSMSVLGGDTWNWMSPILAFSTLLTFPAALCDRTRPSTSSVSSMVPPSFLMILMSFKLTLTSSLVGSTTFRTASTAMGDSSELFCDTTYNNNMYMSRTALLR